MEKLRSDVIKELEMRLGEGYRAVPKDKSENNGLILHGICIHKEGDSIGSVMYLEKFIWPCAGGKQNPGKIADDFLEIYRQGYIPNGAVSGIKNFRLAEGMIRIKLVNYAANLEELVNRPYRKFLDLAVTYYLDMELVEAGPHVFAVITNELMRI